MLACVRCGQPTNGNSVRAGPPPQFVWTAQQTVAQAYSLSLAADANGLPFYLTSLCQQGITVLDASGAPVFQQPSAASGQPGTCL